MLCVNGFGQCIVSVGPAGQQKREQLEPVAPLVEVDDPWGYGNSLEWATSCPPPRHNFTSIPPIRSERPTFDMNHPEYAPAAIRSRVQQGAAAVTSTTSTTDGEGTR